MHTTLRVLAGTTLLALASVTAGITKTERGAAVETPRYRAEFRDGALCAFRNLLTQEDYLDNAVDPAAVVPHLPSGLGTQAGEPARLAAETLYHWPWWEHAAQATWANQHVASAASSFQFTAKGENGATLSYTGLSDGTSAFADEVFGLDIEVDAASGDLLVTPWGKSPRAGVYAANLTVLPLGPAITAEAPIFDGIRIDRNMQHMLWTNAWGGYWDYAFIAFNGYKRGSVAVWTQDAELRYYKTLFYLINPEGVSFSFSTMNLPPFDGLKEAKAPFPWRLQAFAKGWSQAVVPFRDWRLKNQKLAPRPEWTKQVSFVAMGTPTAGKVWLDMLSDYFEKKNLERTTTFAATIRKAAFDTKHYDNTPYDNFAADMKLWKPTGAKLMAYLQPMIMWGAPPKENKDWWHIWEMHLDADTRGVFQAKPDTVVPYVDQHHLGHQGYQRWFLDGVKSYIQEHGADGVYHDQSYHCPLDSRGPLAKLGNMTSVQGMADYFYKAVTENPNSIHGTEHMTEVNNVGTSLGIAGGVLWGTAQSMRRQRIDHASPISNALNWPNGTLFAFPHYSDLFGGSTVQRFHWGMNLMERRAEIAGCALQNMQLIGKGKYDHWVNELWLERTRDTTFVWRGLRPFYPEDWDRSVLSYFKAADGAEFRYLQKPWGSVFAEIKDGKEQMVYARLHGLAAAPVGANGAITGWPMYREDGPAGLHPDRYYTFNPAAKRPTVFFKPNNKFAPALYEGYVNDGFISENLGWLEIRPNERLDSITRYDNLILVAPEAPKALWVNGQAVKPNPVPDKPGEWGFGFELRDVTTVCVLLKDTPAALAEAAKLSYGRTVRGYTESPSNGCSDLFVPATAGEDVKVTTGKDGTVSLATARALFSMPLRLPDGAKAGTYAVTFSSAGENATIKRLWVNGQERHFAFEAANNRYTARTEIALTAAAPVAMVGAHAGQPLTLNCLWQENTPP